MHNAEPAISEDAAEQGTAQPDAGQHAAGAGLRGASSGICLMLIAQVILGAGVNLYVRQRREPDSAFGSPEVLAAGRVLINMIR